MNARFGIDLEAGGVTPGVHGILAIGCYWQNGCGIEHRWTQKVERQFGTIVDEEAKKVNGWESDEQWIHAGAIPLNDALSLTFDWLQRLCSKLAKEQLEPVAHSAAFDRSFLEWGLQRARMDWPEEFLSYRWHCSMQALRVAMAAGLIAEGSAGLDRLIELSRQVKRAEIHDAGEDARFCFVGYEWLLARLRGGQRLTVDDILSRGELLLPAMNQPESASAEDAQKSGAPLPERPSVLDGTRGNPFDVLRGVVAQAGENCLASPALGSPLRCDRPDRAAERSETAEHTASKTEANKPNRPAVVMDPRCPNDWD